MEVLQERLANAKAGIKSSEWPAIQMSKQTSVEERLKKAREDAAKRRVSHQNVQSVENIWNRNNGIYKTNQPLSYVSSGNSTPNTTTSVGASPWPSGAPNNTAKPIVGRGGQMQKAP